MPRQRRLLELAEEACTRVAADADGRKGQGSSTITIAEPRPDPIVELGSLLHEKRCVLKECTCPHLSSSPTRSMLRKQSQ